MPSVSWEMDSVYLRCARRVVWAGEGAREAETRVAELMPGASQLLQQQRLLLEETQRDARAAWQKLQRSGFNLNAFVAPWDVLEAGTKRRHQKRPKRRLVCKCGAARCKRGEGCASLHAAAAAATCSEGFLRKAIADGGFHASSPLAYLNEFAGADLPVGFRWPPPPDVPASGAHVKTRSFKSTCPLGPFCPVKGKTCRGGRPCRRLRAKTSLTEAEMRLRLRLSSGRPALRLFRKQSVTEMGMRLDFNINAARTRDRNKAPQKQFAGAFARYLKKQRLHPSVEAATAYRALPLEVKDAVMAEVKEANASHTAKKKIWLDQLVSDRAALKRRARQGLDQERQQGILH
jgi:hypothetical protein